jgi:hypothetical protein
LLAAFRFSARNAIALVLLLSDLALWGTLNNSGPFVREDGNESLPLLQGFIGTIGVTVLLMAAGISERRRAVVSTQAVVSFASGIPRRKEAVRKAHSFPEGIPDDVLIASVSRYDVLTQLGLRLAVGGKAFAQGLPKTFTMHGERMTTSREGRTRWSYTIC